MTVPNSLKQVIDTLIEKYPNQLPTASLTETEYARLIGQQDVILYLLQHLEKFERKSHV